MAADALHLFRERLEMRITPEGKNPMGTIGMDIECDLRHRVAGRLEGSGWLLETTAERVRGAILMDGIGFRMDFDSADPDQAALARGDNPMALPFGTLFEDVGKVRTWILAAGQPPRPFAAPRAAPRAGTQPAPPEEAKARAGTFGFVSALPWVDLQPDRPFRAGDRGDSGDRAMKALQLPSAGTGGTWEVTAWDSVAGVAEITCRVDAERREPAEGDGSFTVSRMEVTVVDRFDPRAGLYLSREFTMRGRGVGLSAFVGDGKVPGEVSVRIRVDRVDSFEAPASPPPSPPK
jgi:hypothetical protein